MRFRLAEPRGLRPIGLALFRVALFGVTLVVGTVGCGTLSVEDEKELGLRYQRELRQELTLMRDSLVVNYVREIGEKLIAGAPPSPFEFRFYVVEDESMNAFAIPGGAIYLHTGIISRSKNVTELASVMAHEIGHVTARHIAERFNQQRGTGFVAQAAALAIAILTGSPIAAQAGQMGVGVAAMAYSAKFTREDEREADRLAVPTLVRAGYDPQGLVTMFQTMKSEEKGFRPPTFLIDHPATDDRIQNAQAEIKNQKLPASLRSSDGGKLEIIQRRIELIVGTDPASER